MENQIQKQQYSRSLSTVGALLLDTINEGVSLKVFTPESVGRGADTQRDERIKSLFPHIITNDKTKPFFAHKEFWKDGNPLTYQEFCERRLGIKPSPKQIEIAEAIVGKDAYDWDTTYQRYIIAIGQGGGKNKYIIAPVTMYMTYKIANMKDPHFYFSRFFAEPLKRNVKFEMTNSSMVTAIQAKNVHFSNMQDYILTCFDDDGRNWFEKYCAMDIRPEGIGDIKSKKIEVPTTVYGGRIILHSFDSTPSSPEGLSIILGIIDEPSRADSAPALADCELLWKTLIGNLNTRFPRGVGKAIAFSYINISEYDFTYAMLEKAKEEKELTGQSITYAVNLSSFDTNPNVRRTDPAIIADFRNDPTDAEARYLGIKGASKQAFYQPHVNAVAQVFVGEDELKTPVHYHCEDAPIDATADLYRKIVLDSIRGDNHLRCVAMDAGESSDSFVLKMGYIETMDELKDSLFIDNQKEVIVINKRPIIDVTLVWQPHGKVRVNYLNVGEVLGTLIDHFPNIVSVKSDKWQSVKLIQEVKARGIEYKNVKNTASAGLGTGQADTLSFSAKMQLRLYTKLRWMIWNNVPRIYKDQEHFVIHNGIRRTVGEHNQYEHEHLIRENNKIIHPPNGSKDLSDVDAILCNDLILQEVKGRIVGDIFSMMDENKLLGYATKYMELRQIKRNEGESEHAHNTVAWIAEQLGLKTTQTYNLKKYVEERFTGT